MPCTIRSVGEKDIPLLLSLIRELATYEKLLQDVVATDDKLRAALFGNPPAAYGLIAELDGNAVGYAIYFYNFSSFLSQPGLYLEDLFVRPEFRGQGIGKALLLHLAKIANQRGCARMEWTVLDWNEPAKGFYRQLGARILEDWRVCRLTGPALEKYRE